MRARTLLLAPLALLAACTTLGERAEQTRQELIGMPARNLHACIGEPAEVHQDGDTDYVTYRWEWLPEEEEEQDPRRDGIWIGQEPGRSVDGRSPTNPASPDRDGRRIGGPGLRDEKPEPGYCELVFELRDRKVRHVEADGRTPEGLRYRAQCMLEARRCLPKQARRRSG